MLVDILLGTLLVVSMVISIVALAPPGRGHRHG